MKQHLKLFAICAALAFTIPSASALTKTQMDVTFKYQPSAPIETTYKKAHRTAYKACKLNGRLSATKRFLVRSCVQPLVEEFVITTQDPDLLAYHERRIGRTISGTRFVDN